LKLSGVQHLVVLFFSYLCLSKQRISPPWIFNFAIFGFPEVSAIKSAQITMKKTWAAIPILAPDSPCLVCRRQGRQPK
jgi:hypothetical protein